MCLIFWQFEPGCAYKICAYEKKRVPVFIREQLKSNSRLALTHHLRVGTHRGASAHLVSQQDKISYTWSLRIQTAKLTVVEAECMMIAVIVAWIFVWLPLALTCLYIQIRVICYVRGCAIEPVIL